MTPPCPHVLVIAPHPDDEVIGPGGSLIGHAARGERVEVVFLTSGELGLKQLPAGEARPLREGEALAAAEVLGTAASHFLRLPDWGIEEHFDEAVRRVAALYPAGLPPLVYLPHENDEHPDHCPCAGLIAAVWERIGTAPAATSTTLRTYEVWSPMAYPAVAEDVSAVMARKLAALACHASQLVEFDYSAAVEGLNRYRGALSLRVKHAEVFGESTLGPRPAMT